MVYAAFLDASNKNKHDREKELTMNVQHSEEKLEGKRDQRVTAIDPGASSSSLCLRLCVIP